MCIEMLISKVELWLEDTRGLLAQQVDGLPAVGTLPGVISTVWGWTVSPLHYLLSSKLQTYLNPDVLEVEIVTASGDTKILNEHTDYEHFWAVRGGGGNSWGIITSVTYKTHPLPTNIKVLAAQYNTTTTIARQNILGRIFKTIPRITDLGFTGYATLGNPMGLIFIQPNGTNSTADEAISLLDQAGNLTTAQTLTFALDFSNWLEYCEAFLQDPNIATNVIDQSRLLTAEVLINKTEDLKNLVINEFPDLNPGFNFSTYYCTNG